MTKQTPTTLKVVVTDTTYAIFQDTTNLRTKLKSMIMEALIVEKAGIAHTVAPGTYDFYMIRDGRRRIPVLKLRA